ncbi:MAG: hypothetical protein IJB67_07910 [Firmicutes bacterium]|nr:hypothetical protein [Bacillota bacterium]
MRALLHKILLPLLLVFLLPGMALADDFGGYYGEDSPTFTMYKASSVIRPGQESTITLSFNNITNYHAFYGYAVLTVSEDNTKIFGEDGGNYMSREIGTMSRLDVTTVDYVFTPSADLKSGTYDMTATLVFKNRQGSVFTKDYPVKITVDSGTPVDLQITESSVSGDKAVYGQPFDLNVTLLNNGETTARDVRISLNNLSEDKIFQSGSYYSPSFTDIKKYSAEHLTFNLIASDNIADGYHPVELKINYNENGEAKEKILTVYVDVKGSPDSDEDEDGNKLSTPRVILADCTLPPTVNMGEPFRFDFKLKNTSTDRTVKNLQVSLTSAEGTVMPAKGTNSFYVAEIKPGGTASLGLELTTKYDTEKTSYPLTLEIHYEDAKANAYTATENLTIPVFLPTKLTFQNENYPEFGMVGESCYLSLEYINQGKGTIYNLTASVEGDVQTDIGSGTYIGNINSGNQDSLEVMVTPLTAGTTECKLVFTYEDAAGNQLRTEKPFMLTAEEMPEPDPGMMDPGMDMPMEDESAGLPGWLLPVGGVLVLAAAATAFIIKRKKAKAAKLAEEEALFAESSDLDD